MNYGWQMISSWAAATKTIYADLKFCPATEGGIVLPRGPLTYPVLKHVHGGPYTDVIQENGDVIKYEQTNIRK